MSTFRNIIARRRPSKPPQENPHSADGSTGSRLESLAVATDLPAEISPPKAPEPAEPPRMTQDAPRWNLEPPQPTMRDGVLCVDGSPSDVERPLTQDLLQVLRQDQAADQAEGHNDILARSLGDLTGLERANRDDPAGDEFTSASAPAGQAARSPSRRKIWDLEGGATASQGDWPEPEQADAPIPHFEMDGLARSASNPVAQDADLANRQSAAHIAPPQMRAPAVAAPTSQRATHDGTQDRAQGTSQNDGAHQPARSRRVKTRLLGFHSDDIAPDAFAVERAPAASQSIKCPVGWVVIVEGPGRGASFALAPGLSTLGRGADQTISLDFGDDSISRDNHASIAYDEEDNTVLIGHGGKSNLVRLNGKPLVSSEELRTGDQVRVGKTTLRFVALCCADFRWDGGAEQGQGHD